MGKRYWGNMRLVYSSWPAIMQPEGDTLKPALREILVDAQIAPVAIGVLLLWSLVSGAVVIGHIIFQAVGFLVNAVAIGGIPHGSFTRSYWLEQTTTISNFLMTALSFGAAWLLSRWMYEATPFRSLNKSVARFARRNHV